VKNAKKSESYFYGANFYIDDKHNVGHYERTEINIALGAGSTVRRVDASSLGLYVALGLH